jgi:hypothetical protein
MAAIKIAFWNIQNLFDTTQSRIATDLGYTPEAGWTEEVFNQKLTNLVSVIKLMHNGELPDLLGICEIENADLVKKIIKATGRKDYKVAHVESPDIRGIDTSLIYSNKVFALEGKPIGHLVHLRYRTRDVFEIPLRVRENGAKLTVLVNHWPSRSRGKFESEPYRLTVASHCGRIVNNLLKFSRSEFMQMRNSQRALKKLNDRWDSNILLMGDFNDEPFDRSILDFLQASNGEDHLEEIVKPASNSNLPSAKRYLKKQTFLFNCMWPQLGIPDNGTLHFSQSTNTMNLLDQFIISKGLYFGNQGLKFNQSSVEIFKPDIMSTGIKKRPKKFEFDSKKIKKNGYSDHFPITATIETI